MIWSEAMVVQNHFTNKQKKSSYYIRRSQEFHEETTE